MKQVDDVGHDPGPARPAWVGPRRQLEDPADPHHHEQLPVQLQPEIEPDVKFFDPELLWIQESNTQPVYFLIQFIMSFLKITQANQISFGFHLFSLPKASPSTTWLLRPLS